MAWSVVLPMAAFVPVGGTGVVIDLLRTLKAACLWVIPSSPLWPLFQALLTGGPLGATLDHQLTAMIATQAGVTVVALVGAALCLGTRVRPEGGFDPADPYRGYRPACGDDPIVWREYALPTRAGRHWFPAFARYLFALLRHGAALLGQFLRTVLAASAVTIALSIPIGLAVAGAWYGYPAFLENWRFGGDPSAPFVARMALYRFVTYTSFMILSPILVAAVSLPAEYQVEQTRGTWTLLLTTPLSGAEIVRSKMRAKWLALRTLGWALGVLSLLALVCGVIHPLGLVYALTSLALAVWAALAAGTWFALREGSEWSLRRAGAPLGAVVLIVLEAGFCVPALFPSREVSLAIAQYPLQVGLAAAGGLAVSALTGLFAWSITWTVIARFDGWVGRPRRAPGETDAIDAAVVAVSPEPAREVA
jgi:hypothetical protein